MSRVSRMREGKFLYSVFVGNPGGKKPLRRPWPEYEDKNKMEFQVVGFGSMNRNNMSQIRDRWRHL